MIETIKLKLASLNPTYLEIINQSHLHSSHYNGDGNSHFKIIISSPLLTPLNKIERHRAINNLLKEELKQQIHALAIEVR